MVGLIAVRVGHTWAVTIIAAHSAHTVSVTTEVGDRAVAVAAAVLQLWVLALAGPRDTSEPWAAGQPIFTRGISRLAQADTIDTRLVLTASITTGAAI